MDLGMLLSGDDSMYEEMIKENLANRRIVLNGNISNSILEDVSLYILKYNMEDKGKEIKSRKPIYLYIQSNGGDAITGFNLVDIVKSSDTPVYGVCFGVCASMAFHIFIACKKRYCFQNSILLMHDGELAVQNSTSKAKDTMKFFDALEDRTKLHVLSHTSLTEEFYDANYDRELYLYGNAEGKEHGCVDYVIGEDCTLSEILP